MQTSTVFLLLVVLSVVSFSLGRHRSYTVAEGGGGMHLLHSLPKHYGYMAALWAGLPALGLLVLWDSIAISADPHQRPLEMNLTLPQEGLHIFGGEIQAPLLFGKVEQS